MSEKLDHIGVVVSNIDEALKLYTNMLGLTPWKSGIVSIPQDGLKMVLLPIGDCFIELIEPIGKEGKFAEFLSQRGEGIFHYSIYTEDFDAKVKELKEKGYSLQRQDVQVPFPPNRIRLAWLAPKDTRGIWIEIIDAPTQL